MPILAIPTCRRLDLRHSLGHSRLNHRRDVVQGNACPVPPILAGITFDALTGRAWFGGRDDNIAQSINRPVCVSSTQRHAIQPQPGYTAPIRAVGPILTIDAIFTCRTVLRCLNRCKPRSNRGVDCIQPRRRLCHPRGHCRSNSLCLLLNESQLPARPLDNNAERTFQRISVLCDVLHRH